MRYVVLGAVDAFRGCAQCSGKIQDKSLTLYSIYGGRSSGVRSDLEGGGSLFELGRRPSIVTGPGPNVVVRKRRRRSCDVAAMPTVPGSRWREQVGECLTSETRTQWKHMLPHPWRDGTRWQRVFARAFAIIYAGDIPSIDRRCSFGGSRSHGLTEDLCSCRYVVGQDWRSAALVRSTEKQEG